MMGQTESGKTFFLRRRFLSSGRLPRVLIIDRIGEYRATEKGATLADGLTGTVQALTECARRRSWRIVATMDNSDVGLLARALIGAPNVEAGFSHNVGGMALVLSEIDILVPIGHAPEPLRSLWRRGSHAGLSVLADTQRPSNVNKETTSQCRYLGFLALYEPADVEYSRRALGGMADEALAWTHRARHHAALLDQRERRVYLIDAEGRVNRTIDPMRDRREREDGQSNFARSKLDASGASSRVTGSGERIP